VVKIKRNNIKVSIVIANYNRADFIDRAIRSCTSQLIFRTGYEIIVIDDASTDNSMEVIREFESDIVLHSNKENKGVAYCSNIGLKASSGKYWMRVDSDDFINAYMVYMMSEILEHNNEYDFIYCDHVRVDVHGVKKELIKLNNRENILQHGAGIMFRKTIIDDIGGYDDTLRNAEDYDLLSRLYLAGYKGFYLPIPLYRYYIHGKNMTLSKDRQIYINRVKKKYDY
jgi:glycosyltransferase involved in cell wall biosynthesis